MRDGFPLYYDAVNERGLCMAGLNFVGNAVYRGYADGALNVAQFEIVPYILSTCSCVGEAVALLRTINLTGTPFAEDMPAAQLHWLIADRSGAVTVELIADGLKIHENEVGVLTNNPPFDAQLYALNDYMHLSPSQPRNTFGEVPLKAYSKGMGAIGLPGDLSSRSRFVRAAFTKLNSVSGKGEWESVNQFFRILGSVQQQRGCCRTEEGGYEITVYTSCCNADKGVYYYTTYSNPTVCAVDMHAEDLQGSALFRYPHVTEGRATFINR